MVITLHSAPVAWSADLIDQGRLATEDLREQQQACAELWASPHVPNSCLRRAEEELARDTVAWASDPTVVALLSWYRAGTPSVEGLHPYLAELAADAAAWGLA